ncbi:MAG: helix-turn-helix transcriptional regulator [Clostridia bacterium]|nr:helix-turn-helix transcriptional regulator [Clostridia bacterium]MBQ8772059.1 helix-turn-helix transcriptional regulator [Clostridia bacterium]
MSITMGEKIKNLREKAGLSQTELADKLGLSKSVISAYEKGIRNPSFKVLPQLAEALNVSQLYFFEKGEWQNQPVTVDISDLNPDQQRIIISLVNEFKESNK